ncbi:MAG: AAA family ATPase [Gemmatimonadales bacterium]|nr:AAA family ATPase [Gemmatimonadales bacterium]
MTTTKELALEDLEFHPALDTSQFQTTDDIESLTGAIGQPRAVAAIELGVGMVEDGYNIFAFGLSGTGKESLIREYLEESAKSRPSPPDLCYIHNFDDIHRPRLLELPSGTGSAFRRTMEQLVEELQTALVGALDSEEYHTRQQVINDEFKERPDRDLRAIADRAKAEGLALLRTPVGLAFAPLREGEVISGEDFEQLPKEEQERLKERMNAYQDEVQRTLRQLPKLNRERGERLRDLMREVTGLAVGHLIEEVKKKYENLPNVVEYLEAVQADVIEHAKDFAESEQPSLPALLEGSARPDSASTLRRFKVNVLVDHAETVGAPIVHEDNPTYDNLIGRIEHLAQLGALVTDFTLIKGGALHRAHGGYLMLEAHKLLRNQYSWEGLKRALQSRRLRIESLGQALSLVSSVTLEPEPLPLKVQVILTGDPQLYYLLCQLDPDFEELFKVGADFEDRMDRTEENLERYTQLIAKLVREKGFPPLDGSAMGRMIEHSARLAGDRRKLTLQIATMVDLLREASYVARQDGVEVVTATQVDRAIEGRIYRSDRMRDRFHEEIHRGRIMIDTDGAMIGQVNGVSVISLGKFAFGHPSRITARVRLGQGNVVDIEREVELGGRIHSKGVLILGAYLGARYAPENPLSLSASLVFEQTYAGVEGDSASLAELIALISAISEVPIRQSYAVTGSVNQHGQVQAVGGVTEKVEGFFDICRGRGLTGNEGVVIPATNVENLVLRREVREAVAQGDFHIYPVERVDQAIELLTERSAGERDAEGQYQEGTVNALVESRLMSLAQVRRDFHAPSPASESGDAS